MSETETPNDLGPSPDPRAEEMAAAPITSPVFALDSLIGEIEADAAMRSEAKATGRNFGPVTPWQYMTREYGGALPNGLHIVMGGSGVGKTAYALQLAAGCECPALYLSCEMARLELFRRTVARTTTTPLGRLKDGSVNGPQARGLAVRAANACRQLAIMDATQIPASRAVVERAANALRSRHGAPHLLVVVDSLHSWAESHAGVTDEREAIAGACRELRTMAAVLDCPVIAIAEESRASSNAKEGSKLGGGAGSRKIEYGSESVLYLEGKDEESLDGERKVTARFEKNRHGSKGGKVELLFTGRIQSYRDVSA